MRRIISSCVVLMLLAGASAQPAFAASVPARQPSARAPLDLAALVLVPADLTGRPDAATVSGAHFTVADYSGQKAIEVKAAGHVGGYETWLATPGAAKDRTWQVAVALDEFTSADGGSAGFAALASGTSVITDQTIGDQAGISSFDDKDPYDESKPDKGYTLVFRVNRIVATIYVDEYTGKKPKASEAESLGKIVAGRIERGLANKSAGPGLGTRTLRLAVPMLNTFQDNYFRLGGKDVFGSFYGDQPKGTPTFDETYPHATDVYFAGQNDTGDASSPTYFARLARFTSNYWAAKYVKTYLTVTASGPAGWQHVKEIKDGKDFGDQSHTATFTLPAAQGAPGPTIYGAAIVARSGATIVAIRVQGFKRVPVALVEGLVAAQMKCLTATARCAALKVPAGMGDLHLADSSSLVNRLAWRSPFPASEPAVDPRPR